MPTKTNGGPVGDGWGLWSNGYVEGPAVFPVDGEYHFDIIVADEAHYIKNPKAIRMT